MPCCVLFATSTLGPPLQTYYKDRTSCAFKRLRHHRQALYMYAMDRRPLIPLATG